MHSTGGASYHTKRQRTPPTTQFFTSKQARRSIASTTHATLAPLNPELRAHLPPADAFIALPDFASPPHSDGGSTASPLTPVGFGSRRHMPTARHSTPAALSSVTPPHVHLPPLQAGDAVGSGGGAAGAAGGGPAAAGGASGSSASSASASATTPTRRRGSTGLLLTSSTRRRTSSSSGHGDTGLVNGRLVFASPPPQQQHQQLQAHPSRPVSSSTSASLGGGGGSGGLSARSSRSASSVGHKPRTPGTPSSGDRTTRKRGGFVGFNDPPATGQVLTLPFGKGVAPTPKVTKRGKGFFNDESESDADADVEQLTALVNSLESPRSAPSSASRPRSGLDKFRTDNVVMGPPPTPHAQAAPLARSNSFRLGFTASPPATASGSHHRKRTSSHRHRKVAHSTAVGEGVFGLPRQPSLEADTSLPLTGYGFGGAAAVGGGGGGGGGTAPSSWDAANDDHAMGITPPKEHAHGGAGGGAGAVFESPPIGDTGASAAAGVFGSVADVPFVGRRPRGSSDPGAATAAFSFATPPSGGSTLSSLSPTPPAMKPHAAVAGVGAATATVATAAAAGAAAPGGRKPARRRRRPRNLKLSIAAADEVVTAPAYETHQGADLSTCAEKLTSVDGFLFVGGKEAALDKENLVRNGITHVLNCAGHACDSPYSDTFTYRTLELSDRNNQDIACFAYAMIAFIESVRHANGRVLVHCVKGVSRSTSAVILYLIWRHGWTFEKAFHTVRACRVEANPNPAFVMQIEEWQRIRTLQKASNLPLVFRVGIYRSKSGRGTSFPLAVGPLSSLQLDMFLDDPSSAAMSIPSSAAAAPFSESPSQASSPGSPAVRRNSGGSAMNAVRTLQEQLRQGNAHGTGSDRIVASPAAAKVAARAPVFVVLGNSVCFVWRSHRASVAMVEAGAQLAREMQTYEQYARVPVCSVVAGSEPAEFWLALKLTRSSAVSMSSALETYCTDRIRALQASAGASFGSGGSSSGGSSNSIATTATMGGGAGGTSSASASASAGSGVSAIATTISSRASSPPLKWTDSNLSSVSMAKSTSNLTSGVSFVSANTDTMDESTGGGEELGGGLMPTSAGPSLRHLGTLPSDDELDSDSNSASGDSAAKVIGSDDDMDM